MNNSEVMIFDDLELGQLRVVKDESGEPWFCLKDVCRILDIKNSRDVKNRLSERGVVSIDVATACNQFGGEMEVSMTFINESNLYRCIFQSRKAEAVLFQNWVTDVVLVQIRKTGTYIAPKPAQLLTEQMALVAFAQAVKMSEDTCTVAELAKILCANGVKMGQNRLFTWLREHHYLCRAMHHRNEPYQKWLEAGLFKLKLGTPWFDGFGTPHYKPVTLITGKGQDFFIRIFLDEAA